MNNQKCLIINGVLFAKAFRGQGVFAHRNDEQAPLRQINERMVPLAERWDTGLLFSLFLLFGAAFLVWCFAGSVQEATDKVPYLTRVTQYLPTMAVALAVCASSLPLFCFVRSHRRTQYEHLKATIKFRSLRKAVNARISALENAIGREARAEALVAAKLRDAAAWLRIPASPAKAREYYLEARDDGRVAVMIAWRLVSPQRAMQVERVLTEVFDWELTGACQWTQIYAPNDEGYGMRRYFWAEGTNHAEKPCFQRVEEEVEAVLARHSHASAV